MALWRWDLAEKRVTWHRGLSRLIGGVPETYEDALNLIAEDHRHTFDDWMKRAAKGEECRGLLRLDISSIELEIRLFPQMANERVEGIICWMCDISEARSERGRQERLLERLQESAKIGGWEIEIQTHEIYWTPQVSVLHGLPVTPNPPTLDELFQMYTAESVAKAKAAVARTIHEGQPLALQVQLKSGTVLQLKGELTLEHQRPSTITGTVQDVTRLVTTEKSLHRTENRLSHILGSVGTAIWEWNLTSNELSMSDEFYHLLGYEKHELPNDAVFFENLMHPDDIPRLRDATMEHFKGNTDIFSVEYRWRHKSGDYRWTLGRGKIVERDANSNPMVLVGSNIDITQQKDLEKQVLAGMKLEGLGRLAAGIAHDFNNHMMTILGHLELLYTQDELPAPVLEDLDAISTAARSASHLTRELLAFARQRPPKPRLVDISAVLKSTETLIRRLLGAERETKVVLDPDLWLVEVDPAHFEQAIINLVLYFQASESRPIYIEARNSTSEPPRVIVRVSDSPPNTIESLQNQVFEPFSSSPKEFGGTGLSAAYGFILQAGGQLSAFGSPTETTAFEISLQAHQPAGVSANQLLVLVVEDDPLVRDVTIKVLERDEFHILSAQSVLSARQIMQQIDRSIDVLVTDVFLPDTSGVELAKEVLASDPSIGIVFVSGYSRHHIELDGPYTFVPKPFTPQSLIEAVSAASVRRSSDE